MDRRLEPGERIRVRSPMRATYGFAAAALSLLLWPSLGASEEIHDPSGKALTSFHAALDRTSNGQTKGVTRIIQFGDSHTANDLWTGALRRRLQDRFGDAGHGFVIPGRPWSSYRHLDVIHSASSEWQTTRLRPAQPAVEAFGLGGAYLEAHRIRSRAVVRSARSKTSPVGTSISRFDVFLLLQPKGGRVMFRIDNKLWSTLSTHMPEEQPGFRLFKVPDGAHKLEIDVVGNGPVRVFGVVAEREGPGIVVDSVGSPGLRAENLLSNDAALLEAHLQRRQPDLLILAFGSVEANHPDFDVPGYEDTLSKVIAHTRRGAPAASCLLLGPIDRARRQRGGRWKSPPVLDGIIDGQRRAAAANRCGFWDTRAAMGGPDSITEWVRKGLGLRDHVHLNRKGYALLAEMLEEALLAGRGPSQETRQPSGGDLAPEK